MRKCRLWYGFCVSYLFSLKNHGNGVPNICCWMMQCSYTANALIVKSLAFQLGGLSCLSYRLAKIPIFKVTDLFEIVTATEGQVQFLVVKVIIFAHLARLCFNLVVLNELGYRDLLRYL